MKRTSLIIFLAATLLPIAATMPVSARGLAAGRTGPATTRETSGTATGSFVFSVDNDNLTGSGGSDGFYTYLAAGKYSGGLSGTYTDWGTLVVHKNGKFIGWGTELCADCTLGGKTGGYTSTFWFSGGPNPSVSSGTVTFTAGYGALSGLTGGGKFGSTATSSHYSYKYKF